MSITLTPDNYTNFALTALAGGAAGLNTPLLATDTQLTVLAGDGVKLPSTFPYVLVLGPATSRPELVKVTAHTGATGDTLTIVRGQEGTSANLNGWPVNTPVQHTLTAGGLSNLWSALSSVVSVVNAPVASATNATNATNLVGGSLSSTGAASLDGGALTTDGAGTLTTTGALVLSGSNGLRFTGSRADPANDTVVKLIRSTTNSTLDVVMGTSGLRFIGNSGSSYTALLTISAGGSLQLGGSSLQFIGTGRSDPANDTVYGLKKSSTANTLDLVGGSGGLRIVANSGSAFTPLWTIDNSGNVLITGNLQVNGTTTLSGSAATSITVSGEALGATLITATPSGQSQSVLLKDDGTLTLKGLHNTTGVVALLQIVPGTSTTPATISMPSTAQFSLNGNFVQNQGTDVNVFTRGGSNFTLWDIQPQDSGGKRMQLQHTTANHLLFTNVTDSKTLLDLDPTGIANAPSANINSAITTGSLINAGQLNGGVTLNQSGALTGDANTAASFNGTSGYAALPTMGLPTGTTPWSLEAWVKIAANPAANTFAVAFGSRAAKTEALLYINSSGQPVASVDTVDAVGTALTLNAWHHLVAQWDGTSLRLWQDGTNSATLTPTGINIGSVYAQIGAWVGASNVGQANYFAGVLDEVAIYSAALASARISAHYTAATGGGYKAAVLADTPLRYYRLGETTGATAILDSAQVPTLSVAGPTWLDNGKIGTDGQGNLFVSSPPTLLRGNQETGRCGYQFYNSNNSFTVIFHYNYKTVMSRPPTSISLTPDSGSDSGVSGSVKDVYGFALSHPVVAGWATWMGTYTTQGQCLLAVNEAARTFDHHCNGCGLIRHDLAFNAPGAGLRIDPQTGPNGPLDPAFCLSTDCPACGTVESFTVTLTAADEAGPDDAPVTADHMQARLIRRLLRALNLPVCA